MKKVLFMLTNMNIGGTEKAFLNMLETMSPQDYDVTLLLLEKTGGFLPEVPQWVKIETVENYPRLKPEIMRPPLQVVKEYLKKGRILRAMELAATHFWFKLTENRIPYYKTVLRGTPVRRGYDVAVAYAGPMDFITTFVLDFVEAKYKVQWIHFDVSKFGFNKALSEKQYPSFDRIYVVSDQARQVLLNEIPAIAGKTETYLNRVSPARCRALASEGPGYADEFEGLRILTVGRLTKEKGQDMIPEVAKQLEEAGIRFRWYIVGDGNLRKTIEDNAKSLGVEDKIVFLGTQPNPYPYFAYADLYVQTSVHEGYCITLAEARAFDLPIVSTDFTGAHEQLDGRPNSVIVRRDVNEMAQGILSLLDK